MHYLIIITSLSSCIPSESEIFIILVLGKLGGFPLLAPTFYNTLIKLVLILLSPVSASPNSKQIKIQIFHFSISERIHCYIIGIYISLTFVLFWCIIRCLYRAHLQRATEKLLSFTTGARLWELENLVLFIDEEWLQKFNELHFDIKHFRFRFSIIRHVFGPPHFF